MTQTCTRDRCIDDTNMHPRPLYWVHVCVIKTPVLGAPKTPLLHPKPPWGGHGPGPGPGAGMGQRPTRPRAILKAPLCCQKWLWRGLERPWRFFKTHFLRKVALASARATFRKKYRAKNRQKRPSPRQKHISKKIVATNRQVPSCARQSHFSQKLSRTKNGQ